jgi:hypothetical protein
MALIIEYGAVKIYQDFRLLRIQLMNYTSKKYRI